MSSSCSCNSSSTPLPLIPFTTEEITGFTNEAVKSANKAPRNPTSYFFISSLTVSVTPSINTSESSNDLMILIISFISLFEVYPFPALTAPFPIVFLSNLFIVYEVNCLLLKNNQCLLVLSFLNYLTKNQKIHLVELNYFRYLSFTKSYICWHIISYLSFLIYHFLF